MLLVCVPMLVDHLLAFWKRGWGCGQVEIAFTAEGAEERRRERTGSRNADLRSPPLTASMIY